MMRYPVLPSLAVIVPGVFAGAWFVFIGVYATVWEHYYGYLDESYWAQALLSLGLGPRAAGLILTLWGCVWFLALLGVVVRTRWGWGLSIFVGLGSLWIIPVGTLLALFYLGMLALFKPRLRGEGAS